ncbi:MAG TPA: hypothetical protein GYA05_03655 [Acholeplasmataceae bacterium]|nr:hypothetical protein [Acholeplasmataceae bacterium]
MAENRPKPKASENLKAYFVQWWFSGAAYFFVAWGTGAGLAEDPLDLIFFLGVAMGLLTVFVINPIIYHLFTIRRRGKIANKKFQERTVLEGVLYFLGEICKALFINVLVFFTYQLLNRALIAFFHLDPSRVVIPGEPILYACFYVLFLALINGIIDKIHDIFQKEGN